MTAARRPVDGVAGRATASDDRAWEALVARYGGLVRDVARSYRLCEADVEDVVQETWIRFYKAGPRLQDRSAVGDWLTRTTRHEATRRLHRVRWETVSLDRVLAVLSDERPPATRGHRA